VDFLAQVIDYSISVPSNAKTQNEIVVGAVFTDIAKLGLNVSLTPNRVRLIANVGITQTVANGTITFRVLRDALPIYTSTQGTESCCEINYNVFLQALDFSVPVGFHVYTLQAMSSGGTTTLSPREFSGLAIQINS
jgi:hypothetical protein